MMLLNGMAGGQGVLFVEAGYALALLLLLLVLRIWLYYHLQMKAMELALPLIRKAICAHLYAGREYRAPLRLGLGADLQMIFDLTKWRFRDFFPNISDEEQI